MMPIDGGCISEGQTHVFTLLLPNGCVSSITLFNQVRQNLAVVQIWNEQPWIKSESHPLNLRRKTRSRIKARKNFFDTCKTSSNFTSSTDTILSVPLASMTFSFPLTASPKWPAICTQSSRRPSEELLKAACLHPWSRTNVVFNHVINLRHGGCSAGHLNTGCRHIPWRVSACILLIQYRCFVHPGSSAQITGCRCLTLTFYGQVSQTRLSLAQDYAIVK